MKSMPAGRFKARCLRVMEEVKKYRTPVVITKKGKPVAKLVPPDEPITEVFGCMADRITIAGDVEGPVLPSVDDWDMTRVAEAARFSVRSRRTGRARRRAKAKR